MPDARRSAARHRESVDRCAILAPSLGAFGPQSRHGEQALHAPSPPPACGTPIAAGGPREPAPSGRRNERYRRHPAECCSCNSKVVPPITMPTLSIPLYDKL